MEDNKKIVSRVNVSFAAIDPVIEVNYPNSEELESTARDYVYWGKKNDYPLFLAELRKKTATLHSIIEGCVKFAVGDRITVNPIGPDWTLNRTGESIRDFATAIFWDLFTYGGFSYEVIRNQAGQLSEVHYTDFRNVRSNKENEVFYYSEDWKKRFGKKNTDLTIPKFTFDGTAPSSLVYYKNVRSQTYPECPFESAVLAAMIERAIDEYHLNNISNGFTGSYIVNFNNGEPTDQVKEEIEKTFNKKFSGYKNAGRIVFSWNASRDNQTTLQKLEASDFSEKYDALSKHSRQQLFTAFRANPNLFGIPTENLGFSSEEYEGAFKLFNRTVIQPAQQIFIESLQRVWNAGVEIKPFTLDGDGENTETANPQNE